MSNTKRYCIVAILLFIVSVIVAIGYTQAPDWDFINYHYYNGWAFWNNRYDIDFMPASFRSYFNPLLDAVDYFLIERLNEHPYIFLIIKHLRYFVFLFFSYLILDYCLVYNKLSRNLITFISLTFVAFSPIVLLITNYSLNDLTTGTLLLISIYICIRNLYEDKSLINFCLLFIAGSIIGIATGLKYSSGIFGIALLMCLILHYKKINKPVKTILVILLGMFSGFIISNGWWMYFLYNKFGNPVFPYFSNIFHSEYTDSSDLFSKDFMHLKPKGILNFLFLPLRNTKIANIGTELPFYDIIIPLSFITIIIYFALIKFDNATNRLQNITKPLVFQFLLIFCTLVYYLNQSTFAQYRYIIALYPVLILAIIVVYYLLFTSPKLRVPQFNILTLCFIFILCIHGNNFYKMLGLRAFIISIITCIFLAAIYFSQTKNKAKIQNKINAAMCLTLLLFFSTSLSYMYITYSMPEGVKNVICIKDAKIEDGSTVLLGTVVTTAIIPYQNKNVTYHLFDVPPNVEAPRCQIELNSNRHYYTLRRKSSSSTKQIISM